LSKLFNQTELLENSPLAIVICDSSHRIIWCNALFLDETKLDSEQVIGKLYPALPLEAIDKNAQLVQVFGAAGANDVRFQHWQTTLEEPKGAHAHYFTRDRHNRKKLNNLSDRVMTSQLPKRASWVDFLDYEVSRSRRYDNPLSLLKLHLLVFDKPESVCEQTLHNTIKDTLMDELRWADMIGHTDQGTYLMVLPETPTNALESLKVKLDKALSKQIEFICNQLDYKILFGEANWRKHDDSQSLLKRARESLVEKLEALVR